MLHSNLKFNKIISKVFLEMDIKCNDLIYENLQLIDPNKFISQTLSCNRLTLMQIKLIN